ncbi:MAG: metallopeptidase family protein [Acidimicrobiia bacterium]
MPGVPANPGVVVSRERFEELVADALDSIPESLGSQMDNVVVMVDQWPTPDQLDGHDMLFGLYEGVDLTRRGPMSYELVAPDRITVFQGSLQQVARDEADLAAQVRTTVLHEVGHHFGLSDARLEELGWA